MVGRAPAPATIRRVYPFVVLALALAVVGTAVMVVTGRHLLRNVRKLGAQIKATNERLMPLQDELQSELAVTSLEVEGLNTQIDRLRKERQTRARDRRVRNPRGDRGRKRQRSRRRG